MNKKAQNARIIAHEVLFALAVALFFVVLVMIALGYRLRRDSESGLPVWERTALLRVGSFPTGANIILNNTDTGRRTTLSAQRLVISAGNHTLRVDRDGYHSWQHAFTATEAEITWFDYIQLFPVDRGGNVVQSFASTQQVWRSPIGERALVLTPATRTTSPQLNILTLTATNANTTAINFPSEITEPDLISWSKDDSLALLCQRKSATSRSSTTDRCTMLDVDRGRLSTVNLPNDRSEELLDVAFVNSRTLLVITSARAYLYDTTNTTSQKLNVHIPTDNLPQRLALTTSDATLLYFTSAPSNTASPTYHLATVNANGTFSGIYTDDAPFEFAATRYLNDFVVAIAGRSQLRIYFSSSSSLFGSINGLALQNEYPISTPTSPITTNGRFIVAASGQSVDLERLVSSQFDNNCHGSAWQKLSNAQLYCPDTHQLMIKDFDGTNQVNIRLPDAVAMPPADALPAALVNRRTLYYWTLETINNTPQLQLRQLRL
ncbi:PEGA domain-containing protein [Candidatus Saccharibacteria bacterium]|nr:PEGA domain-containing protein [Candidatus Saccharibacteria bacterium]